MGDISIEFNLDEDIEQNLQQNQQVCNNAAQMLASAQFGRDLELDVESFNMGISSTSQSTNLPVTVMPKPLSDSSEGMSGLGGVPKTLSRRPA